MAQKTRPQAETLSGSPQPNFTGYEPSSIISKRDPTSGDTGYPLGQVWVNKILNKYWALSSVAAGSATWLDLSAAGSGSVAQLTGNAGVATPVGGNINVVGAGPLAIAGAGSTLTGTITPGASLVATIEGAQGGGARPPTAGNIIFTGSGGIAITGAASTITVTSSAIETLTGVQGGGAISPAAGNIDITGAGGISVTGAGSTLTITGSAALTWNTAVVNTATVVNNGYVVGAGGTLQFTLPAVAVVGDTVRVLGSDAAGWAVVQNAGQSIHLDSVSTSVGVGGSLASTQRYQTVELICTIANTDWVVASGQGNFTIV